MVFAENFGHGQKFEALTLLFCHNFKICRDLHTFWKTLGKKCVFFCFFVFFLSKTVFLGQDVHYYMVYVAYFTELILQICDYAEKQRI